MAHASTLERWKAFRDHTRELHAACRVASEAFRKGIESAIPFPPWTFRPWSWGGDGRTQPGLQVPAFVT
ncbi:MAG: hypothetical protein HYV07_30215 [Deltaproteobacteria bacterium]|nr:hypothetical protein [Deltaproteobacteria bacterium]